MPRLAAVDLGTNSVKMTIADAHKGMPLQILAERMEFTRLGRGVDQTKELSTESIEATLTALTEFAEEAHKIGAKMLACGTSAMRDAKNGDEFRARASLIIGTDIQIIAGIREAKLSFWGALSDLENLKADGQILAFDVGGGSTELIVGDGNAIKHSDSINIGAVRITERELKSDPASESEVENALKLIDDELHGFDFQNSRAVVGIGGTAKALLSTINADGNHASGNKVVTMDDLQSLRTRLAPLTVAQKREIPGLEPKRADIIFAGLLIIIQLLKRTDLNEITVSSRGVRHGLLIEAVSRD